METNKAAENALSLRDLRHAIAIGEANLGAVKPEVGMELETRLLALRSEKRRIERELEQKAYAARDIAHAVEQVERYGTAGCPRSYRY